MGQQAATSGCSPRPNRPICLVLRDIDDSFNFFYGTAHAQNRQRYRNLEKIRGGQTEKLDFQANVTNDLQRFPAPYGTTVIISCSFASSPNVLNHVYLRSIYLGLGHSRD